MTIKFTDHVGRERQIFKDRRAIKAHAANQLSDQEFAAKPWFFRIQGPGIDQVQSLKVSDTKEALRLAKDLCRQHGGDTNKMAVALAETATRGQLTCASLAAEYIAAGYPDRNNRKRTGTKLENQVAYLESALAWFGTRSVAALRQNHLDDYLEHVLARVAARRAKGGPGGCRGSGIRIADLEVNAVSNCFAWAVRRGRIDRNPLDRRQHFQIKTEIVSHRFVQPRDGDELHTVASWLCEQGYPVQAAKMLFHAMTGLRPVESETLRWHHAAMAEGTPGFRGLGLPMTLSYVAAENQTRLELLHVTRSKAGINPAVVIHPALGAFLGAWRSWSAEHFAPGHVDGGLMFPMSKTSTDDLSALLNRAAVALGSPKNRFGHSRRTAHSLRAYYVTVRRAQGVPDVLIANELGQGSGAIMVRTYGAATDVFGSGRYGWLPTNGQPPAWELWAPAKVDRGILPFASAVATA